MVQDGDSIREVPIAGPGVLLTRESKIKSISLLDDPEPAEIANEENPAVPAPVD